MVSYRLKIIRSTMEIKAYANLPQKVILNAMRQDVNFREETYVRFKVDQSCEAQGYPESSQEWLYAGNPRGEFPGNYLIISAGWGQLETDSKGQITSLSETKYLIYVLLREFNFTFYSDILTGNLCIDLRGISYEQVDALEKHVHAMWSYSHHAAAWGWNCMSFREDFGLYSEHEARWPYQVPAKEIRNTQYPLDVPKSANAYHLLKDEAETFREEDRRFSINYELMIPVQGRKLRTSAGITIDDRTTRREVLEKLHFLNPLICGSSKPLGMSFQYFAKINCYSGHHMMSFRLILKISNFSSKFFFFWHKMTPSRFSFNVTNRFDPGQGFRSFN